MDAAERVGRLDALLEQLESLRDEHARKTAVTAIQTLLELYGEALARIMRGLPAEMAQALAKDDLLKHLLLVHGLHPVDVESRVRNALPRGAELLGVKDGTAYLRVHGGCLSERAFIERAIEEAAPDVDTVEFETGVTSSFVALDTLVRR